MLFCCMAAPAQETTGGISGTIKDNSGAVVSGARVVLTSPELSGDKNLTTNSSGTYRFVNLPPGAYTLTVNAPGFSELKRENIRLDVGRFPTFDLALSVGAESTVVEVSSATPQIDITQSRTQTTISADELEFAPHGRSFQSEIQFDPGSRSEQLNGNGGYSIDGGTTNENGYLIDGINTISVVDGTSQANTPIEFIQEVSVKTSGYDAEYGGAVGGVVTAVMRKGGNQWHGNLLTYYEADPLDASPTATLRYNPATTYTGRTDAPYQYYTPVKDHFRFIQPGFNIGGPLIKDRLQLSFGLEPLFLDYRRTINVAYPGPPAVNGPRIFTQDSQQYFTQTRLDYRLTDRFRFFGSMLYQYYRISGSSLPNQDDIRGLVNSTSTSNPDNYNHGIGNVQPNVLYTVGADMSLTNSLVATTRYGYFYQNYHDRGLPTGVRHLFSSSGVDIAPLNPAQNPTNTSSDALNQVSAYSDLGANTQTVNNQRNSQQFSQDISYFKKFFFGAHNLKAGYLLTHVSDNVNTLYNSALVRIYPGATYSPTTSVGQTNCSAIEQTNLSTYGTVDNLKYSKTGSSPNYVYTRTPNTTIDPTKCMGDYGYLTLYDFSTTGQAATNNQALYGQDSWTLPKGVTLNLGVRFETEKLPSFNNYSTGINFGLTDKVAPRLGGAWDVFQNGKLKVFGSYGVFYDVVKLHLAIDSFGAAYGHVCAYALDTEAYSTVNPVRDASGHFCPASGPGSFANGQPAGLRFIENNNLRVPSNDPATVAAYGQLVDPDLKPYREHETVAGVDYQISHRWAFESRYERRRLDHAIEDVGILDPVQGEVFHIDNPGEGQDYQPIANCTTCKAQPRAAHMYDAAEFRFTRLASRHWYAMLAYTYSHLRGNYSGLTDTDIADGNTTVGRTDSNDNRSFDEAYMQFDAHGNVFNGLLGTDRPHSFKAVAYYRFQPFKRHETALGVFQTASSGTPLSTYFEGGQSNTEIYPEGRGKWMDITTDGSGNITFGAPYLRRTPSLIQTDLSFTHSYAVSPSHESWRLGFQANFTNLLNMKHATVINSEVESTLSSAYVIPPAAAAKGVYGTAQYYSILENGYDYRTLANTNGLVPSNEYGRPSIFQTGRAIRLMAKFEF